MQDWISLTGIMALAAGVLALRFAWGRKGGGKMGRHWPSVLAGWVLTAGGLTCLALGGADRAVAVGILMFILFASVAVGVTAIAAPPGRRSKREGTVRSEQKSADRATQSEASSLPAGLWPALLGTVLLAGPLSGAAAVLSAALLFRLSDATGMAPANSVIIALMGAPLVWTALVAIVLSAERQRQAAFLVLAVALAGATTIPGSL